jgi:hypothetical protein
MSHDQPAPALSRRDLLRAASLAAGGAGLAALPDTPARAATGPIPTPCSPNGASASAAMAN